MGSLPTQPDISAIAVDPRDPHRVYAAGSGGVVRSDDAGVTWQPAGVGVEDASIVALTLDPADPDTLHAVTRAGDLLTSGDGAATWHAIEG